MSPDPSRPPCKHLPSDSRDLRTPTPSDLAAIAESYSAHVPDMRRLAGSILRNEAEGDDLVHDVFVEACEKWARYDPARGSVRSWLMVRLRSRAIDRLRRRRFEVLDDVAASEEPARGCDPHRVLQGNRAWKLLGEAPEPMRRVVALRFEEDLSVAETAERLGIPRGTVKSRHSLALRGLRARIESGG